MYIRLKDKPESWIKQSTELSSSSPDYKMANNYRDYVQINNQKIAPQVPTANKIRDPGPC